MPSSPTASRLYLRRFALLSIAAAIGTLVLKSLAWGATDSVGLLSDALESLVNLGAALLALLALTISARPPDQDHAYGHDKVEFFAAGLEGALILLAAGMIAVASVDRFMNPQVLGEVNLGLVLASVASGINLVVGRMLIRAGKGHGSPVLTAEGHHLMTDVWSSVAVVGGVWLAARTGWALLDPLLGLGVAILIVVTGVRLVSNAVGGLMDTALPPKDLRAIRETLATQCATVGAEYHALRTRRSGARAFMSVHVLVPGAWTVQKGHDFAERIETELRSQYPSLTVLTHLEPIEDPRSHADLHLDR